jgi:Leucine-rich repeat (LRR) protein
MVSMNCSNKGIRKILVTNGACLISGNTFILHSSTRTLFCGNNYIKKLPLLKNLVALTCYNNNIRSLHNFPNLVACDFRHNRIKTYPRCGGEYYANKIKDYSSITINGFVAKNKFLMRIKNNIM